MYVCRGVLRNQVKRRVNPAFFGGRAGGLTNLSPHLPSRKNLIAHRSYYKSIFFAKFHLFFYLFPLFPLISFFFFKFVGRDFPTNFGRGGYHSNHPLSLTSPRTPEYVFMYCRIFNILQSKISTPVLFSWWRTQYYDRK